MFKVIKKSEKSLARLGLLKTNHGRLETPFFMPVATQGVAKTISPFELEKLKAQIALSNVYHLMLEPGAELIKKSGGLHKFIGWKKTILTDSGGFQIFSLAQNKSKSGKSLVKIDNNGVEFRSYINGKKYYLTPEKCLHIQKDLGIDIAVCLDVCLALPAKKENISKSVDLTTSWAKKTKIYFKKIKGKKPLLFAVIQGGLYKDLRLKSLSDLVNIGFDGYNIGGLSVGEEIKDMYKVLDYLVKKMPEDKPRYLMGVGYPENIIEAVKRGVDMFDCVIPTREGRHGRLYKFKISDPLAIQVGERAGFRFQNKNFYEIIDIKKSTFKNDFSKINEMSKFKELRNLSKAYLHHLFKIKEPLGARLATLNNLEFYINLMKNIRESIKKGEL